MKPVTLHSNLRRRQQNGSAVLAMLAFLVLIVILWMATTRAVLWSRQEVALIDKQQVKRLAASTNAPTELNLSK